MSDQPSEFQSLKHGLHQDFKPVGTMEGMLVENLSAQLWRLRRVIYAESAEISKAIASSRSDMQGGGPPWQAF